MEKVTIFIASFIVAILGIGSILRQSGGTFLIEKSVIGNGGGQAVGGTFVLDGTISEHVSGTTSTGDAFQHGSGF